MSKKSAVLIILQSISMIFLLIFNSPITIGIGMLIQIFGILIGLWGILTMRIGNFNIHPEVKSESLITKGPYKWIRNPMYLSVILFYLPIIVENFSLLNLLVFIILIATLLLKMNSEEQFLEERFGTEYLQYKSKTKRIIPFLF